MIESISDILKKSPDFISGVLKILEGLKCDVSGFELDHICYRTETLSEYQELKKQLTTSNTLLADNEHNGREISVFKLENPIQYINGEVDVFELPAPKSQQAFATGYEHVEFVIPMSLREFVTANPHLNFNIKNIDDLENPSIKLKLSCGSVKFHLSTLAEIV